MNQAARPAVFVSVVAACALIVGIFHLLIVGGILVLSTMEIRIIHLALMMVILFTIFHHMVQSLIIIAVLMDANMKHQMEMTILIQTGYTGQFRGLDQVYQMR